MSAALGHVGASEDKRWTVADLLNADFPEIEWAVPGLVHCGLTFLAGRPKIGKSWLTLQLAGAVGTGGEFLGQRAVEGRVLVYALEDSPRRLKQRLALQKVAPDAAVTFSPMKWDGWAELEQELSRTDYRLVIVDTISRTFGAADQNDPGAMTAMLAKPQRLALQHNTSILVVDHHRKSHSVERGIDDLIGSTAKSAVADTILKLCREQGKHDTFLQVTGRDIEEEKSLVVKFDQNSRWQLKGEAAQGHQKALRNRIIEAISELSQRGLATNATIADAIGRDRGQVNRAIVEMCAGNQIEKAEKVGREQPYLLPQVSDNNLNSQQSLIDYCDY